ncbi:hypothetical protein H5410_052651 [Solanum commersonii]|uniref:Uncharacterized protein n=1 Tax=Solanum commersonii TaxID=4109 RepID=A0A9J5X4Q8_SOLCO|nr:hypothetical protein H5410_052651 [Solanum commersonii]
MELQRLSLRLLSLASPVCKIRLVKCRSCKVEANRNNHKNVTPIKYEIMQANTKHVNNNTKFSTMKFSWQLDGHETLKAFIPLNRGLACLKTLVGTTPNPKHLTLPECSFPSTLPTASSGDIIDSSIVL